MTNDIGRYSKRLVQYFWDPLPKNDDNSDIWCLGRRYASKPPPTTEKRATPDTSPSTPSNTTPSNTTSSPSDTGDSSLDSSFNDSTAYDEEVAAAEAEGNWPEQFMDDFEAKIWLTYRSGFPLIPKSQDPKASSAMSFSVRLKQQLANQHGFTSDSGWGCMIRTGQTLLANTLLINQLGRDWRRGKNESEERQLISLFADDPKAPFSIHKFVEHGASACGKHPGEWFGPSATARCIKVLTDQYSEAGLRVYSTGDSSDVYEDRFFAVAKDEHGVVQPTLILLGIRLGIDRVTPVYWDALQAALQMPQSVGIAGGRPSSSHYFLGTQGPHLFYLDPHTTRPALILSSSPSPAASPSAIDADAIAACHTRRLRRMHVREMDPSMLMGFLIRDAAEWARWRQAIAGDGKEQEGAPKRKPIVHVADREPVLHGTGAERQGAIDEVEAFSDEDDAETVC
ncbi:MAG: Cysteine protease atg4 [Bathelium mastoideum]|nr:MAG: Cysteine protease atg4 [Bathelium mastoideum]